MFTNMCCHWFCVCLCVCVCALIIVIGQLSHICVCLLYTNTHTHTHTHTDTHTHTTHRLTWLHVRHETANLTSRRRERERGRERYDKGRGTMKDPHPWKILHPLTHPTPQLYEWRGPCNDTMTHTHTHKEHNPPGRIPKKDTITQLWIILLTHYCREGGTSVPLFNL